MKNFMFAIIISAATLSGLLSSPAHAVQGEWWEISGKMEMPGMPAGMADMMGGMGAQKNKICLAQGQQADPAATSKKEDNCTISDMRQSGNTVKFNMKCTGKEPMTGSAELTHTPDSFNQKIKMRMDGEDMLMTTTGKRIGGACDADEMRKKADAMVAQGDAQLKKICDTSKYTAQEWAINGTMFIGIQPACPGKKDSLCQVMRQEAPRNLAIFTQLNAQQTERDSIAKACGLDMNGTKKSLCKSRALKGPQHFLEINCPAEAKVYRELVRKREDCAERGFTSGEDLKSCMGGKELTDDDSDQGSQSSAQSGSSKQEETKGINSKDVLDGAKQLKGLFGF